MCLLTDVDVDVVSAVRCWRSLVDRFSWSLTWYLYVECMHGRYGSCVRASDHVVSTNARTYSYTSNYGSMSKIIQSLSYFVRVILDTRSICVQNNLCEALRQQCCRSPRGPSYNRTYDTYTSIFGSTSKITQYLSLCAWFYIILVPLVSKFACGGTKQNTNVVSFVPLESYLGTTMYYTMYL